LLNFYARFNHLNLLPVGLAAPGGLKLGSANISSLHYCNNREN